MATWVFMLGVLLIALGLMLLIPALQIPTILIGLWYIATGVAVLLRK